MEHLIISVKQEAKLITAGLLVGPENTSEEASEQG